MPWGNREAYDQVKCEDGKRRTFTVRGTSMDPEMEKGFVIAKTPQGYRQVPGFRNSEGNFFVNRMSMWAHAVLPREEDASTE